MKLNTIGLIFCFFFCACTKEKKTYSTTIARNTTAHSILVIPYLNGNIFTSDSFSLNSNSEKEVLSIGDGGIGSGTSYAKANQYVDSFVVIFDKTFSIVHYKPTVIGLNPKRYLFSSKRNLYNDTSYLAVITSDDSGVRNWKFTYTFTEQDYLDAK